MYLVYMIICDGLYYIGMTNDFLNRWLQHNGVISGGAKYTRRRSDWYPICIIDGFKNKSEAMQCEWKFKTRKSRFARKFKGINGRLNYLNLLLKSKKWTSKSPNIADQNLSVYVDEDYEHFIDAVPTQELYWK